MQPENRISQMEEYKKFNPPVTPSEKTESKTVKI